MAIWSSMHTWQSFDHISSTIHQMLMILDFLEMGERDIQLSCWTKFHLKLFWTCNFVVKNFPFLETSLTSHFLFLATFLLTLFSSFLMFEMSNETCLDMNEVSLTLSHLQIHQLTCGWLLLTDKWIGHALMNLSLKFLMKWLNDETLASISSI